MSLFPGLINLFSMEMIWDDEINGDMICSHGKTTTDIKYKITVPKLSAPSMIGITRT